MRFVKIGAVAVALAGLAVLGSGVAQADETISVTAEVLGCAVQNNIDLGAGIDLQPGKSITVSDDVLAELKTKGCLD
ncbi:hypothetical protein BJY24_006478 [Nocardia transvalensis]|uniref:Uncharacterized protein n=1 Tax=Nocardia transvalensis TaxID=37333 RepID=A0A7W9ULH3_9NOCA|nr:hypothetical protein [Nocardia transvalensis]MBB5917566.1 hypothetical protein [Nocardia transvalensis]